MLLLNDIIVFSGANWIQKEQTGETRSDTQKKTYSSALLNLTAIKSSLSMAGGMAN